MEVKEVYISFADKLKKWQKFHKQSRPVLEGLWSDIQAIESDFQSNASVLPSINEKLNYLSELSKTLTKLIEEIAQIQQKALATAHRYLHVSTLLDEDQLNGISIAEVIDYIALVYNMLESEYQTKMAIIVTLNPQTRSEEMSTYCMIYKMQPFIENEYVINFQKKWETVTAAKKNQF